MMNPWELLTKANDRAYFQADSVGICIGHMLNAVFDLEAGETKATAIATLKRGLALIDEREAPMRELAQAIEAQRAETAKQGSVEDESAVATPFDQDGAV